MNEYFMKINSSPLSRHYINILYVCVSVCISVCMWTSFHIIIYRCIVQYSLFKKKNGSYLFSAQCDGTANFLQEARALGLGTPSRATGLAQLGLNSTVGGGGGTRMLRRQPTMTWERERNETALDYILFLSLLLLLLLLLLKHSLCCCYCCCCYICLHILYYYTYIYHISNRNHFIIIILPDFVNEYFFCAAARCLMLRISVIYK